MVAVRSESNPWSLVAHRDRLLGAWLIREEDKKELQPSSFVRL